MKIGIITFHKVNNYGAVLQAYALQKSIHKLGHECDIIDYGRKNLSDVLQWQKNKLTCLINGKPDRQGYSNIEFVNMFLNTIFFNNKTVSAKFNLFRRNYNLSMTVNNDNINTLNKEYDLFLSGSDQVWNCGRVNLDKNYFLDFVDRKEKKGSYAASFGIKEIPIKYKEEYKRLLSDYQYVSVREKAGADIIKELIHRDAEVVLDPTLLLTNEEWFKFIGKKQQIQPVIVVYMLEYSECLLEFAKKLSVKTGYSLRLLNKPYNHKVKMEYRLDVGPMEWLSEFQNAAYIVTNSFHGVAFSINFNKAFFVEIAEERIRGAMSSRIEHILKEFHLEERLINSIQVEAFNENNLNIDYSKVNSELIEKRKQSLQYIKNMIQAPLIK